MVLRRRMGCWGPLMGIFISFLAMLALAFVFRLEIHTPNYIVRFGPQLLGDVQAAAATALAPLQSGSQPSGAGGNPVGGNDAGAPGPAAGGPAATQPASVFGGLNKDGSGVSLDLEAGGLLDAGASVGPDGVQLDATAGNGAVDLNAGVGGGQGVQVGASVGDGLLDVNAGVGGGNGVNVDVDTNLGVGANVGAGQDGVNVGVDLPGEDLDVGVNVGGGGCTVWLLGRCIVP